MLFCLMVFLIQIISVISCDRHHLYYHLRFFYLNCLMNVVKSCNWIGWFDSSDHADCFWM